MTDNSSHQKRSVYLPGIGVLVFFLITLLVYAPALKNNFIWDDIAYVCENPSIQSLNLHSLHWMLTTFHSGNWHPITWLSHAIDYALWGLDPLGHHLTNIIMHGLNTLLVFLLTIRLIVKAKEANGTSSSPSKMTVSISTQAMVAAGVTALLFGLHPLHVESVAWVAERKDLLCAFFFLLSIASYLAYTSSVVKRHRWIWFTTCLLLFILALMSKPMAVTLPLILLLLDIYPLKRLARSSLRNLSIIWEKTPFFILSIVSGIITIMAQHAAGAIGSLAHYHLGTRLLNASRSLLFYLEKMLVPVKLVPFYPFPMDIHWLDLPYLLSALLVLAITGGCLWMVKRGSYLPLVIWLYYVITLIPVIGIVQVGIQAAADRYTYLPSLSIFLLTGVGVSWVYERGVVLKNKGMLGGLALALICIFIFLAQLTIKQIKLWRSPEILWSYVINAFPEKVPLAHNNLGLAYVEKGKLDEAVSEYKKAIAINPNLAEAHNSLGTAYYKKGELDKAISEYKQASVSNPHHAETYYNLGFAYRKKGMLEKAIFQYKKAIDINSHFAKAHNNLGDIYNKKGLLEEAISEYRKAIAINPNLTKAHYNLGNTYNERGKLDKAILEYKQVLTINPHSIETHYNLGNIFFRKGRLDEAISEFKKALVINPNFVMAHVNLGVAYRKKGMLDQAISEYKQALVINPNYAGAHNNLSFAYYAKGNYKLALFHCNKALELAGSINPKLLELLKPYR